MKPEDRLFFSHGRNLVHALAGEIKDIRKVEPGAARYLLFMLESLGEEFKLISDTNVGLAQVELAGYAQLHPRELVRDPANWTYREANRVISGSDELRKVDIRGVHVGFREQALIIRVVESQASDVHRNLYSETAEAVKLLKKMQKATRGALDRLNRKFSEHQRKAIDLYLFFLAMFDWSKKLKKEGLQPSHKSTADMINVIIERHLNEFVPAFKHLGWLDERNQLVL